MAAASTSPIGILLGPTSFFCSLVLLQLCSVLAQGYWMNSNSSTFPFEFSNFNSSTTKQLAYYGLASCDQDGALQLISTPNGSNSKTGAVVFKQLFNFSRYYVPDIRRIRMTSISTIFDISTSRLLVPNSDSSILSDQREGMSFVVYERPPCGIRPQFDVSELSASPVTAIHFDVRNNKVGVRNNMVGMRNALLCDIRDRAENTVQLSYSNGTVTNHTVWIDFLNPYDETSSLRVFIAAKGSPKPGNPLLMFPFSVYGDVFFGFTSSKADDAALRCTVWSWKLHWNFTDYYYYPIYRHSSGVPRRVIIPSTVSGVVMLILAAAMAIYVWKKKRETDFLAEALRSLPDMPKEFKYTELKKATNNFSNENKLGQGGFGEVYRGKLPKDGKLVAIKKFIRETDQGGFLAELTIINRLRHRNLVRLLGWSHRNKRLLLVYEYMPNGSLDKHLFNQEDNKTLSWDRRYNILVGVASALHYLHNEFNQKVVHRDLKASNIMLDVDFDACLGDFGLARAIDNGRTSYVEGGGIPGTWGYIAPECLLTGKATRESDIFGFGAVVLEAVSGRRPGTQIGNFRLLVDWVWTLYKEGQVLRAVDPRLKNVYDVEDAHRLLLVGLACSHPERAARPNANEILQIMRKSIAPPTVPLVRPPFMMESMSFDDDHHLSHDSTNEVEVPIGDHMPLFYSRNHSNYINSTTRSDTPTYCELASPPTVSTTSR